MKTKLDWLGIVYLVVGIFCLIWLLERGDRLYWFETFSNIILLVVSLSSLSLFCAHELMIKKPVVDLRVLNNRIFSSAVAINFILGFVVTATLFILPIYMQEVLKFTPTKAGETLAPRALFMMLAFPVVGYLFNRVNSKLLIYGGMIIGLTSAIAMTKFTHETGWHDMLVPQILQGLAVVLILIPVTTIGLRAVKLEKLAAASGFDAMSRQIGGILGIAVFASLITHFEQSIWGILRHNVNLSFSVFYKRFEGVLDFFVFEQGSSNPEALQQSLTLLFSNVGKQVSVITYMNLFQIISLLFVFMFILSIALKFNKNERNTG